MALIRKATFEDAAALAHVHVLSWRTTYRDILPADYLASLDEVERIPRWQEWLTSDIDLFVAEIEGEVIGFAGGGPIREPLASCDAELYTLYLLEEAQRQGFGCALLKAVAQTALARGFRSMIVWVLEGNPATHFYTHLGARHVSQKQIEIGTAIIPEHAFCWSDLSADSRSW